MGRTEEIYTELEEEVITELYPDKDYQDLTEDELMHLGDVVQTRVADKISSEIDAIWERHRHSQINKLKKDMRS